MNKNQVVKPETKDVVEQMPDFAKGKHGTGTESLSANAITPPRLKLMQALSPELQEMKVVKAGDFLNNVTGTNYGQTVRIIPCYLTEAYFLFAPRAPGSAGGLLARAIDGVHWSPPDTTFEVVVDKKGRKVTWKTADTVTKSGLDAWGTFDPDDKNSPPAAVHALNCVTLCPDHLDDGPMVLSFVRSALKIGKKFAGNLKLARAPSYSRIFELSSMLVNGPSGDYYEPRIKALGFIADAQVFASAESVYEMSKERGVDVDLGSEASASHGAAEDSGSAY